MKRRAVTAFLALTAMAAPLASGSASLAQTAQAGHNAASPAQLIAMAIADPTRPEKDRARDAARKPAELLAFAGVKRGDVVVDVIPGTGYWSRLFSKIVGPKGKVYAYVPQELASFKSDPVAAAKAMAAEPGRENVSVQVDPLASDTAPANTFDVVWTFQNYHDLHDSFMHGADVDAFNRVIFKALKPGGVYVIVDHAAEAGSGLKHTEDLHRIDPAAVRAEVEKAGFKFDGEANVLANPADPHTALVFDASIRGKTDQFAFRFKKPK
jgi:predicted methyltransferase